MRTRLIGRLLALLGLYALFLAAIGNRFAGKGADGYTAGLIELLVVTIVFLGISAFVATRRPREPLE